MKTLRKNGGFTLVELVVVIAILAILAGVAVPAYTGYIKKAEQASDIATCDAIKTAVFAAYAEEGQSAPSYIKVTDGKLFVGAADKEIAGDYKTNFEAYYGATIGSIKIKGSSAVWNGGEWTITPKADN